MYGDKWIQSIRQYHITSKQINSLSYGDKIKLVCFDRNFCDHLDNIGLKKGIKYSPSKILTGIHYHMTYTHINCLMGKVIFRYTDSDEQSCDFEFDVEYSPNNWYPP